MEIISDKLLIGKRLSMSLTEDKTFSLWQSFMSERKKIPHAVSNDLFSVQVYHQPVEKEKFNTDTLFTKWAAVEVWQADETPENMESLHLPGGLHAVFHYRGAAGNGGATFRYIFESWLPASGYMMTAGHHFEIMGEKYKNNDPDSEEEIWIPVIATKTYLSSIDAPIH